MVTNFSIIGSALSKKYNSITHHIICEAVAADIIHFGREDTKTTLSYYLTQFWPYLEVAVVSYGCNPVGILKKLILSWDKILYVTSIIAASSNKSNRDELLSCKILNDRTFFPFTGDNTSTGSVSILWLQVLLNNRMSTPTCMMCKTITFLFQLFHPLIGPLF